jgi:hypothetical protein
MERSLTEIKVNGYRLDLRIEPPLAGRFGACPHYTACGIAIEKRRDRISAKEDLRRGVSKDGKRTLGSN